MLNVLGTVGIYITQKSLQINDNDMIILLHNSPLIHTLQKILDILQIPQKII